MTIRAVMFDYGNVLCSPQLEGDIAGMAELLGLPLEQFQPLYWGTRDHYDLSHLDGIAYWSGIARDAGISLTESKIADLVKLDSVSWARPNHVMASWVKHLRSQGISVAIISNMPPELKVHITKSDWLPEFDHYTFSCDIGAVKPDPAVYHHCLEGLKVRPDEALFLDDRQPNVDASVKLGIASLLFKTAEELHPQLERFGLPGLSL